MKVMFVRNIPSSKTDQPLQMFRCTRKFSAGTNPKVAFHSLPDGIFKELFVKGKRLLALKSGIQVPLTENLEFC